MSKTTKELIELAIGGMEPGYTLAEVGNAIEITTPFLDRHGDHIQVYVRVHHARGHYITLRISDDYYAIADLLSSGMMLDDEHKTFRRISQWLAVTRSDDDELVTYAHPGTLADAIVSMAKAIRIVGAPAAHSGDSSYQIDTVEWADQ